MSLGGLLCDTLYHLVSVARAVSPVLQMSAGDGRGAAEAPSGSSQSQCSLCEQLSEHLVLARVTFTGTLAGKRERKALCSFQAAADLEGATVNAVFV